VDRAVFEPLDDPLVDDLGVVVFELGGFLGFAGLYQWVLCPAFVRTSSAPGSLRASFRGIGRINSQPVERGSATTRASTGHDSRPFLVMWNRWQ
jgi:hypothetical protein